MTSRPLHFAVRPASVGVLIANCCAQGTRTDMFLTSLLTSFTSTTSRHHVPTLYGWSPGLRALLNGAVLSCGCLAGTYVTWSGTTVDVIDAKGCTCGVSAHIDHAIVPHGLASTR